VLSREDGQPAFGFADTRAAIARGLALARAAGMEESAPLAALLSIEAEPVDVSGGAARHCFVVREPDSLLVVLYGSHSAGRADTSAIVRTNSIRPGHAQSLWLAERGFIEGRNSAV
jgi:hypothetical protein